MKIEDFLRLLKRVKKQGGKWSTECPAHDDKKNSLGVEVGLDGRILVKCFATCPTENVVKAMGLEMRDLFPESAERQPVVQREEHAHYDYTDEEGRLLFQVVRFIPKDFRQRRPDGAGGWIWSMEGVRRVPYRLPELLDPRNKEKLIHFVEGEKDVDRLREMGYLATTNPMGAGKWLDAYSEHFEGREIVILPDNDEPGMRHAKQVKESMQKYRAKHVEIVRLPGLKTKGDVSEWFDQAPGDVDGRKAIFDDLIYDAFNVERAERAAIQETHDIHAAEAAGKESWDPYELANNMAIHEPEGFLYGEILARQSVSIIHGPSGSGKSYFVMYLGAQIALAREVYGMKTAPGRVLFLSEEMGGPDLKFRTMLVWSEEERRLLAPNRFHFRWFTGFDFGGKTLRDNSSVHEFVKICDKTNKPDIVFIDSLSKIHNADENSNQQMGVVMKNLELAARMANVCIVIIHHMGKASEFRTGAARARGASCIVGAAGDVISVECISIPEKRSVVSFEKTRSLAGRPAPQPFIFTQEIDPSGRVITKSDGSKVPGITFVIGKYEPHSTAAEQDAKLVKEVIKNLCAMPQDDGRHTEDGRVYRHDLVNSLKDSLRWSEPKAHRAIQLAAKMGFVLRGQIGKESVYFLPKQN